LFDKCFLCKSIIFTTVNKPNVATIVFFFVKYLKYLNKYFLKYKFHLIGGFIFIITSNIFGVIPPRIVRYAFDLVKDSLAKYKQISDAALQNSHLASISKSLLIFGLLILAMALIKGLFMFLMRQTIVVMSRHIEFDLKNEIYEHYQKLDISFFKKNNTGDLMSRATEDVSKVRMYLGPAVLYTINTTVLFIIVVSTMLSVNPKLTFYVLLPLPVLSFSIFYINKIINKRSQTIQAQLSKLTNIAQENYNGIRVVKTYVQEWPVSKYFTKESEEYKVQSLKLARIQAFFFPLMILLIGLSTILTIYIGGIEVAKGNITAGNIAEFVIYVNMLTWPVASVGWVASLIQQAAASQKRINEFLQTQPLIESNNHKNVQLNGHIVFKNVHFKYQDSGIQAINNLNLEIKAGEKIALVGRTGCGKTTLIDLLLRMYDIDEGELKIDDKPIKDIELESLRTSIAFVPQDVFLFSDTIMNNINFGVKEIDFQQVESSAKAASVHSEIENFKYKYTTMVGERGVTLSGGQKQRISIARALLKKANILILDDSLSAVDANTEKTIFNNLKTNWKNKTVIFVTHRAFALDEFDKIVMIENGTVVAKGQHKTLMNNNFVYAELFKEQQYAVS